MKIRRKSATAYTNIHTRAEGIGVREFRQTHANIGEGEAKITAQGSGKAKETEQVKDSTLHLHRPSRFILFPYFAAVSFPVSLLPVSRRPVT
jgi:hypothetical protein